MRIHTIDVACPPSPLINAASDYFSQRSLDQCDAVLWNPAHLHAQLVRNGMELSVGASMDMFVATRHWRDEFERLWRRGGTVVVFLPADAMVQAHHFEGLIDLNLLDALGVDAPRPSRIAPLSGTLQSGGQPFHDFFARTNDAWAPASMLEHGHGTTVLRSNDGKILSSYQTRDAGRLLFLPQLADSISANDHAVFLQAICLLTARLSDPSLTTHAAWLADLSRPNQIARETAIEKFRRDILALQQKIDALEAATRDSAFEVQLVAGTGLGVFRAVFNAIVQMNPSAEKDWLNESIVIVPGEEGAHVVKTVLFGEDLDDRTLNDTAEEIARIARERGPLRGVTLVDCRDNIVPLNQRARQLGTNPRHQLDRRGWKRVVGADLFVLLSSGLGEKNRNLTAHELVATLDEACNVGDVYSRVAELLQMA